VLGNRTNPHPQELLAHEALHVYLAEINAPMTYDEQHAWIKIEAPRCAGTA
jgi:hypothetical protein